MKFTFIAKHREIWVAELLCGARCLAGWVIP
jgi:hypothetical protein